MSPSRKNRIIREQEGNNSRREIELSEEEQKFSREGRNIFLGEKLFQLLEKKRISIRARYRPLRAAKFCGEIERGSAIFKAQFCALEGYILLK